MTSSTIESKQSINETTRLKDNLEGWNLALEQLDSPEWNKARREGFSITMGERYRLLDSLGLMDIPYIVTTPEELQFSASRIRQQMGEDLYVFIEPLGTSSKLKKSRYRTDLESLRNSMASLAKSLKNEEVQLLVVPYYKILLNGSVMVNSAGMVRGEFTVADSLPSRSNSRIRCAFDKGEHELRFRYTAPDAEERQLMLSVILRLPKYDDDIRKLWPGYYELSVARDQSGRVKVLFSDFRNDPAFMGDISRQAQLTYLIPSSILHARPHRKVSSRK